MRTAPVYPGAARIEAKIEIAFTHDVSARMRKCSRNRLLSFECGIVKSGRANCQKISVVVSAPMANWQNSPVIGVADEGCKPVRPHVSTNVREHLVKLGPVSLIDFNAVGIAEHERVEQEFCNEAVIARRCFE